MNRPISETDINDFEHTNSINHFRGRENDYERVQVSDRNRFKFSKKITRGYHLLDQREWIIFNYMSEGLFFNPSGIEPGCQ